MSYVFFLVQKQYASLIWHLPVKFPNCKRLRCPSARDSQDSSHLAICTCMTVCSGCSDVGWGTLQHRTSANNVGVFSIVWQHPRTLNMKMFTNKNWNISSDVCTKSSVNQRLSWGPCRIGGAVLFSLVRKPTVTHSTETLAGAETFYFWSLRRVPCYDYLKLTAFDSFAATLWNPSILVQLLHDFSLCFNIGMVGADRNSMPALGCSTPTLFYAEKYVVAI